MLRKTSFVLLSIAFIICFGLWFEHYRVWQNSIWKAAYNCRVNKMCFSGDGPHTYGFLAEQYLFVLLFLLFFFIGKFIKSPIISITVCLSSIILIIYQFLKIRSWYSNIIETFSYYSTEPNFSLLRSSVPFIWIFLSILFVLTIIQIVIFLKPFLKSQE